VAPLTLPLGLQEGKKVTQDVDPTMDLTAAFGDYYKETTPDLTHLTERGKEVMGKYNR